MTAPVMTEERSQHATAASTSGLLADLSSALGAARAQLATFLELVSLEARRAGLTLASMLAVGLVAAVCALGAWFGLLAALAIWAVSIGFGPIAVAIAIASFNLLAGAALLYLCVEMSRALLFPATRRHVAGRSSPTAP